MPFIKLLKSIGLIVIVCVVLNTHTQAQKSSTNSQLTKTVAQFQAKTFKVQSLPFDMNGLHLQFQYVVKEDVSAKRSKQTVFILSKKLFDMIHQKVVLDFWIEQADISPVINLSDIDKAKYNAADFEDFNFDGYKDIREVCETCGGATNSFESVYLFDPGTRKFGLWRSLMGVGVDVDKLNKTVKCYQKNGNGEFNFQEIKFTGKGIQLYEKKVSCTVADEAKRNYKIVYDKYVGKKRITHKTKIITNEEHDDIWTVIDKLK